MRLGPDKPQNTGMRLTQEKVNKLAAVTADALASMKSVEFNEPYEDVMANCVALSKSCCEKNTS
jgi:hypothetical protein